MNETNSCGGFNDKVCIEVMRVFDSCSDKDCLEDLEVSFTTPEALETIEGASFIKCKRVEVVNAVFGIEPVPFNKGFYAVDITYTFSVEIEAFEGSSCVSSTVVGTTSFSKKVILFGSDGNTRRFSSEDPQTLNCVGSTSCYSSLPNASVTVVEPIMLDCRLVTRFQKPSCCTDTCDGSCCQNTPDIPVTVSQGCSRAVYVTIGMFSIIQLSRYVTIMVPTADYCIPSKECSTNTDSPCELFEKIKFPTNEFFPRSLEDSDYEAGCVSRTTAAVSSDDNSNSEGNS